MSIKWNHINDYNVFHLSKGVTWLRIWGFSKEFNNHQQQRVNAPKHANNDP